MKHKLEVLLATLAAAALMAGVTVAASTPAVVTGSASSVTSTTAKLHGTVNPEASNTTYFFQSGLTVTYGLQSPAHSAGHGSKPVDVGTTATGLIPGTIYHYRLVAVNRFGTSIGRDRTFITTGHPPAVVLTGPTFGVGHSFAIVTGSINPEGEATDWAFQYGTSAFYDKQTYPLGTLGPVGVLTGVHTTINGLSDGTTFHYRLIAIHGGAIVSYGGDQTFTTLPFPRRVPVVHASTGPTRARTKPYLFTTSGTITPPRSIPASVACNGTVAVRFFVGHRSRAFSHNALLPNCAFSVHVLFHRRIDNRSMRLRVEVRFRGNAYLASASARAQRVRLG